MPTYNLFCIFEFIHSWYWEQEPSTSWSCFCYCFVVFVTRGVVPKQPSWGEQEQLCTKSPVMWQPLCNKLLFKVKINFKRLYCKEVVLRYLFGLTILSHRTVKYILIGHVVWSISSLHSSAPRILRILIIRCILAVWALCFTGGSADVISWLPWFVSVFRPHSI